MTTHSNDKLYSNDTDKIVDPWYVDSHGKLNGKKATIHRITASDQSLVSSEFVREHEYVGQYIKFKDITGSVDLPLACVHVESKYFTGHITAAVTNNLDRNMLLANDVAKDATLDFKDFNDTVIRRDPEIVNSDFFSDTHDREIADDTNDRDIFIDTHGRDISIDTHDRDISIDTRDRDISIDTRDRDISIDTPDRNISVDTPDRDMSIDTHDRDTFVDTRDRDVSVDTRDRDISVDTHDRETSIDTRDREVSFDSRDRDISVDTPDREISNTTRNKYQSCDCDTHDSDNSSTDYDYDSCDRDISNNSCDRDISDTSPRDIDLDMYIIDRDIFLDLHDRDSPTDQNENQGGPSALHLGNDSIHKSLPSSSNRLSEKQTMANQLMVPNQCKDTEFQYKGTKLVDLIGIVITQISILPRPNSLLVDNFVGTTKSLIPHLNVQEPIKWLLEWFQHTNKFKSLKFDQMELNTPTLLQPFLQVTNVIMI